MIFSPQLEVIVMEIMILILALHLILVPVEFSLINDDGFYSYMYDTYFYDINAHHYLKYKNTKTLYKNNFIFERVNIKY